MNESHVAQVAALEKLCFSDPWSETSIASELENPLSLWLIAEEDGAVCGYVGSQTVLDETDMMNIAVRPDCRRKGIAAALIAELVSRLKARGSRILRLEVRESNLPAIALYKAMGFTQLGLRKNYYRNPKENALILGKEWEI
ncbi:MAG: ribosomal protein S18-alanine N-acetyltransferase [Candidatus Faecousia sp.]|nr:ribosomal protein S18-alanine N-acetyltransferase [Candidatus Faecousia sp.]